MTAPTRRKPAVYVNGGYSYCRTHGLRRRCPACEATLVRDQARGSFPQLDVPTGTAEWLREAAKFYDSMGTDSSVSFVEWVSVDLKEPG